MSGLGDGNRFAVSTRRSSIRQAVRTGFLRSDGHQHQRHNPERMSKLETLDAIANLKTWFHLVRLAHEERLAVRSSWNQFPSCLPATLNEKNHERDD